MCSVSRFYGENRVPRCRVYRILGIKLTGDTTNLPAIKNIRWFPTRLICTTQTVPDVLWRRGYDLVLCRPIVGPTPPKLPAFAAISGIIAVICPLLDRLRPLLALVYNITTLPQCQHLFCEK
jgi:hypothetical protein